MIRVLEKSWPTGSVGIAAVEIAWYQVKGGPGIGGQAAIGVSLEVVKQQTEGRCALVLACPAVAVEGRCRVQTANARSDAVRSVTIAKSSR